MDTLLITYFLPLLLEITVTVQLYLPMPQMPLPNLKLSWSITYLFSNDWGKRMVSSKGGKGEFVDGSGVLR